MKSSNWPLFFLIEVQYPDAGLESLFWWWANYLTFWNSKSSSQRQTSRTQRLIDGLWLGTAFLIDTGILYESDYDSKILVEFPNFCTQTTNQASSDSDDIWYNCALEDHIPSYAFYCFRTIWVGILQWHGGTEKFLHGRSNKQREDPLEDPVINP